MRYISDRVNLLLVGEGVLQSTCEDLVNKLELNKRVFFLGFRTDIPELLKTVDIVVLSSKYEGLSLSCIEGMVSGKPFIASRVPGLTEIVEGAGLLFECCNEKELAFCVQELLDNPTYYEKVAKACQERGMQYNIQIMLEKHISLYKSL
jgi:glycosyltransferase involved in cell wall biosynthesis